MRLKIFGCGPTRMLKALSEYADAAGIECELSLEGDMACGIGICQGCPVERADGKKKYSLVCVEGPTFNSHDIILR
jgi:dihydroorotate dehydrogenase electron transfer subunit